MERVAETDADRRGRPRGGRLSRRRAVAAVLLGAAGLGLGGISLALQDHFLAEQRAGASLNPVAGLLADGSGIRTVWVGYAAAVLFATAVLRLRLGPEEPPLGRPRDSAAQMRTALRAEYRVIRAALVGVAVVAALDLGRAAVYAVAAGVGRQAARDDVGWVVAEAIGIALAALTLRLWLVLFGRQLDRVGAL